MGQVGSSGGPPAFWSKEAKSWAPPEWWSEEAKRTFPSWRDGDRKARFGDRSRVEVTRFQGKGGQGTREWPIEVEVVLQPPGFMTMAFIFMYGGTQNFHLGAESLDDIIQALEGGHWQISDGQPIRLHPQYLRSRLAKADEGAEVGDFKVGDEIHCKLGLPWGNDR